MEKVKLKVGDAFVSSNSNFYYFRVLELDRTTNYIKIALVSVYDVEKYIENWSLDSTEAGFEVGDYKLIK